jgi:hypothetical protein
VVLRADDLVRRAFARLRAKPIFAISAVALAALGCSGIWFFARKATGVLAVSGAPAGAPPLIVALPPRNANHTTSDGYIIALRLSVTSCKGPVVGDAKIVLPVTYFQRESDAESRSPSFYGFAVDGPRARIRYMKSIFLSADPPRSVGFSDNGLPVHAAELAVMRVYPEHESAREVDVGFTADWLRPRGYGSCWLQVPSLMGDEEPRADLLGSAVDAAALIGGQYLKWYFLGPPHMAYRRRSGPSNSAHPLASSAVSPQESCLKSVSPAGVAGRRRARTTKS